MVVGDEPVTRRLRLRRVYTIPGNAPQVREFSAILAAASRTNDGWITFTCDAELYVLDLSLATTH